MNRNKEKSLNQGKSILTYTGLWMVASEPKSTDIRIFDIAHALSMLPRANGHFRTFFSVAQHSLNCSYEGEARQLSKRMQLALLLHDGAEAYVADLPRPVKRDLTQYRHIEIKLTNAIFEAFHVGDLTDQEKHAVDVIDTAMLYYEFHHLHNAPILNESPYILSRPWPLKERPRREVEEEFIDRFRSLVM